MTLYAFDDIDDAIAATRSFLWPFDLGRWAKLALVAFFLGGVGGFNPFSWTSSTPPTGGGGGMPSDPGSFPALGAPELAIIGLIVAVILVVGLLFLLVGSIMEFVFVESLRHERVSLRRYWSERWGQGLRLFGFRFALGILTLAVVALLGFAVLAPVVLGNGTPSVAVALLAILVFVVVAVVTGLVQGFTTVFVVPIMVLEDRGVLSAWRRFWPTMTGQWKQYLTYVVMGFVLQLAAGLVTGIVMIVLAILLAIPFVVLGLVGAGMLAVSSLAGWVVIGVVVALYLLAIFVVGAFVAVPVQAFLRYYALLILGDTEESFDLIPERRATIRGEETGDASPS